MKFTSLAMLALSAALLSSCGNNDADNDTSTDTTTAAPVDGGMSTGSESMDAGAGTDMNSTNDMSGGSGTTGGGSGTGGSSSSNMNNGGGSDNTGTGISTSQAGGVPPGTGDPTVRGREVPTGTNRTRDKVTNDSLNNRTGMGSSR